MINLGRITVTIGDQTITGYLTDVFTDADTGLEMYEIDLGPNSFLVTDVRPNQLMDVIVEEPEV